MSRDISESIKMLEAHIASTARVAEWAELMGYKNERRFSRHFVRHFRERPSRTLTGIRLKSIAHDLRTTSYNHQEIAWRHSLPDEKALYNFVKYHAGCSPTQLKKMPEDNMYRIFENLGSKFRE